MKVGDLIMVQVPADWPIGEWAAFHDWQGDWAGPMLVINQRDSRLDEPMIGSRRIMTTTPCWVTLFDGTEYLLPIEYINSSHVKVVVLDYGEGETFNET